MDRSYFLRVVRRQLTLIWVPATQPVPMLLFTCLNVLKQSPVLLVAFMNDLKCLISGEDSPIILELIQAFPLQSLIGPEPFSYLVDPRGESLIKILHSGDAE